jgi:hypothetical protein
MPLYYTGVLSSYKFDDYLDGKLGVVNGSNSDNNTTTNPNAGDGVALLAALNVTAPGGNANWSNNFQYSTGNDNNTSVSTQDTSLATTVYNDNDNISAYTVIYNSWGNWAPKFANDKLLLAFNALLANTSGSAQNDNSPGGATDITASSTWYGAGAYAKYQFNDWFSLCSRGEYLGSNNSLVFGNQGTISTAYSHVTGNNLWEYTLTAGFNVIDNLLIRAEYRMDWGSNIYNTGTSSIPKSGFSGLPNGSQSGGPAYYAGAEVVYSF